MKKNLITLFVLVVATLATAAAPRTTTQTSIGAVTTISVNDSLAITVTADRDSYTLTRVERHITNGVPEWLDAGEPAKISRALVGPVKIAGREFHIVNSRLWMQGQNGLRFVM